jgi:hypothetical protein
MADANRKPASKKPAKRGPTKAAALKALGLTQEDLDYIKERHEPVNAEPQVHEASAVARPGSGFGGQDPQATLEDRPAPTQEAWNAPDTDAEPVWYVRNLRGMEVGFRLTRQNKQGEKRTNLKPRGSRGDIVKLEPGDLKDSELQTQVAYGLVEVIPEGEALEAIRRQYTNAQTQVPAHIAALTNEYGKPYQQANPVKMASDEEAFGVKVADLNPDLMQGKLSDKEIKRDAGIVPEGGIMQPVQTPRPGNIVSDGFLAPTQGDSQLGSNDERSQQVDALARSKQFEGPGAGLGEVTVKVEPVRREG